MGLDSCLGTSKVLLRPQKLGKIQVDFRIFMNHAVLVFVFYKILSWLFLYFVLFIVLITLQNLYVYLCVHTKNWIIKFGPIVSSSIKKSVYSAKLQILHEEKNCKFQIVANKRMHIIQDLNQRTKPTICNNLLATCYTMILIN